MHLGTGQWHPTPVPLPGKSQGRRSLVGCNPWGLEELDTTERVHFHFSLSCIGEGNGNPLQRSCLENPRDRGAWWAAVYGVTQSQTQLKQLSSSSSSKHLTTYCGWKAIVSSSLLFFYYSLGFSKPQHVGISLTILFHYYSIFPYREKPRGRHFPQAHCFSSFNCWNQPW